MIHDFQGYFSRTFQDRSDFAMTFQVLEFSRKNPTLSRTFQEAWEPCHKALVLNVDIGGPTTLFISPTSTFYVAAHLTGERTCPPGKCPEAAQSAHVRSRHNLILNAAGDHRGPLERPV